MADVTTESIRNIALIGNTGVGKTQLAEALLHQSGAVNRLGTPDEGNTVSDFEPEEKQRGSSISTAVLNFQHNGVHVNLLDTPGYSDFIGGALRALSACDTAVLVVSAALGVDIHSRRLFKAATDAGLARFVVVNKADAENTDLAALAGQVQEALGSQCRPLALPVGQGPDFKGVVDAFASKEGGEALMDAAAARGELIESIIEADESLMERYLGDEEIADEELTGAFTKALVGGTIVPVLYASARQELGVEELLANLVRYAPNPKQGVQRTARKGTEEDAEEVPVAADPAGPLYAQVFKVVSDPFVGKISYLRVYSGRLEADATARVNDDRRDTKFGQILRCQGKDTSPIPAAVAGDIVGLSKMEALGIGDTVSEQGEALLPPIRVPVPMYAVALQPKSRGDEQKISEALAKMMDEDNTLAISRDSQTNELVVSGLGDIHVHVLLERMKRRYQVEVDTKPPKIPYRETLTGKAEGHYRHKKQTGGAGQFGEVYLRVEPLERDSGFEFVDDIFGGAIPRQFLPAVEKGVREAMAEGVVAGYPFQDARVTVYDGKHHPVDSKEVAFKIAGRNAFREAVKGAKPAILEPYVNMSITVPDEFLGSITGDLNSRRGRIMGMAAGPGGTQTIEVQVPLAEVAQYNTQLRSITGGQGSYTMELSHYEPVPAQVQQQIIEAAAKEKEQED